MWNSDWKSRIWKVLSKWHNKSLRAQVKINIEILLYHISLQVRCKWSHIFVFILVSHPTSSLVLFCNQESSNSSLESSIKSHGHKKWIITCLTIFSCYMFFSGLDILSYQYSVFFRFWQTKSNSHGPTLWHRVLLKHIALHKLHCLSVFCLTLSLSFSLPCLLSLSFLQLLHKLLLSLSLSLCSSIQVSTIACSQCTRSF